jgi:hypothetical protein
MKLSKEDIQFIDTYLENSEVVYVDIRMEMVDHVASDIEGRIHVGDTREFYYIFKDYMVENKAQLLEDNKQFLKSADKKIGKALLKEFVNPLTLLIFLASCIGFYLLYLNFNKQTFELFVSFIPLLCLAGFALIYVVYYKVKNLKRFSGFERLGFLSGVFFQITNIFFMNYRVNDERTILWVIVGVSLTLALMFMMFKAGTKLFKSYKSRFKNLA